MFLKLIFKPILFSVILVDADREFLFQKKEFTVSIIYSDGEKVYPLSPSLPPVACNKGLLTVVKHASPNRQGNPLHGNGL
jgi:hypothetical protein